MKRPDSFRFSCSQGSLIFLAVLVLLIPLRWLAAAVVSALIHELFHLAALWLLGVRVYGIRIGINGAKIRAQTMSAGQELICALAGPLGGLTLLGFAKWFPAVSICAAFHTMYNLLPVYPTDGGRVLWCGARLLLPPRIASAVCRVVQGAAVCAILAVGLYAAFGIGLGPIPLAAALTVAAASRKQK